jgi:hypothetical protein
MSETKQPNWLPWVLVAGLAYFAFMRQPAIEPVNPDDNKPQPVASVNKILDAAYKADRSDKLKTLKEFADKQFPSSPRPMRLSCPEAIRDPRSTHRTFLPFRSTLRLAANKQADTSFPGHQMFPSRHTARMLRSEKELWPALHLRETFARIPS